MAVGGPAAEATVTTPGIVGIPGLDVGADRHRPVGPPGRTGQRPHRPGERRRSRQPGIVGAPAAPWAATARLAPAAPRSRTSAAPTPLWPSAPAAGRHRRSVRIPEDSMSGPAWREVRSASPDAGDLRSPGAHPDHPTAPPRRPPWAEPRGTGSAPAADRDRSLNTRLPPAGRNPVVRPMTASETRPGGTTREASDRGRAESSRLRDPPRRGSAGGFGWPRQQKQGGLQRRTAGKGGVIPGSGSRIVGQSEDVDHFMGST
ncbi:hypothetical protein J2S42_001242 [Catenuloplanes indicus]|uniref:Uncharacterized protein n=1 Tax=Catenuloplanes indicus TaxID=137267 RepID=A0AAE3VUT1_9ACTN|nr:hypothetical protein [Catenuloplanes indicus]